MRFYRLMGSDFQILDGEKITHVPLPGPLAPGVYAHLVGGERYAAIGNSRATAEGLRYVPEEAHGLWLYDQQEGQLLTVPIKVTKEDCFTADSIMGPGNTLYFSDGNSFGDWGSGRGRSWFAFNRPKGPLWDWGSVRRVGTCLTINTAPETRCCTYMIWIPERFGIRNAPSFITIGWMKQAWYIPSQVG